MKKCPKSLTLVLMTSLALGGAGCSSEPAQQVAEEFRTFGTVSECVSSQAFTADQCQEMFTAALAQTPTFANLAECEQKFGAGNCGNEAVAKAEAGLIAAGTGLIAAGAEQLGASIPTDAAGQAATPATNATGQVNAQTATAGQGGSFMPMLAGYMMGRYLGGGAFQQGSQPLYRGPQAGTGASTGAGASAERSYRTGTGDVVKADPSGRVANPGSNIRKGFASTAKPVAARGTATSRGGFSGNKNFGSSAGS